MSILEEILSKIPNLTADEKIKQICDQIIKEEESKFENKLDKPEGPNIFLALEVPGITRKEICFITLERDFPGKFVVALWAKIKEKPEQEKKSMKKTRVWEINETDVKKILKEYVKIVKFMKGE